MTRIRVYFTVGPAFAEGPYAGREPVHMYLAKLETEWTEGPRGTRLSEREACALMARALEVNAEYSSKEEYMFKGEIAEGAIPDGHRLCCWFDVKVGTRNGKPHFGRTLAERIDFSRKYIPVWDTCLDVQERMMSGLAREESKCREGR